MNNTYMGWMDIHTEMDWIVAYFDILAHMETGSQSWGAQLWLLWQSHAWYCWRCKCRCHLLPYLHWIYCNWLMSCLRFLQLNGLQAWYSLRYRWNLLLCLDLRWSLLSWHFGQSCSISWSTLRSISNIALIFFYFILDT